MPKEKTIETADIGIGGILPGAPAFYTRYHPLTSRPFLSGESYTEYRPSPALLPYILCYWTSGHSARKTEEENREGEGVLVIPDSCVDIIVHINYTKQKVSGYLCGIQDEPFLSHLCTGSDEAETFAVRFYFWSAGHFLKINCKDTPNKTFRLEELCGEWSALFEPFLWITGVRARIALVEAFLLEKLAGIEWKPAVFNSVQQIIAVSGRIPVKEVCEYSCISQRQLERLFLQEIGLPVKRIASLIRYQNVWREIILSDRFDIHDAVYRYGYTDQAHLLKEFRRFHGTGVDEARRIALLYR